jgi:hypothetical protein
MTFEGPRIVDVAYYVREAWREYGISVEELMTWTYAEQSVLHELMSTRPIIRAFGVIAPPPHHRFG